MGSREELTLADAVPLSSRGFGDERPMEMPKSLWPPKGRAAIAAWSGAGVVAVLGVATVLAWPALVRPEPPLEADAGRDGVRISLVQPPKAAPPAAPRLDVGLSEAALAMAGQQAPASAAPPAPERRSEPPAPIRASLPPIMPDATTPLLVEDDRPPPVREDEVEPRWERDREADDRYEAAERLAQERAERQALRRAEQQRELNRWDDYPPPPLPDDRPPPERW